MISNLCSDVETQYQMAKFNIRTKSSKLTKIWHFSIDQDWPLKIVLQMNIEDFFSSVKSVKDKMEKFEKYLHSILRVRHVDNIVRINIS